MTDLSFAARLAQAGAAIGVLAKDGYNKFHDYEYVTEAAVKRAVGPALRDAGLYIKSVSHVVLPTSTIDKVLCSTLVVVADEAGNEVTGTAIGSGTDKGDKAAYKAMAGGLKYALTGLFLIPTGDDAENDGGKKEPKEPPAPPVTPKPAPKKEPAPTVDGPDKTESTKVALALTNKITNALSEAELKNLAEDAAKSRAKMTDEDYNLVKSVFKARMAEVKENK